jgi:hypothetical protein
LPDTDPPIHCRAACDERLVAIHAQFRRHGCELIVQESTRGPSRGGWLARYRCRDSHSIDGVAHGNTELEAAELALAQFRSRNR